MDNKKLKEEVSKIFYEAAKKSWENRIGKLGEVIIPNDSFSGVRAIDVSNLPPGALMNLGFDGVGTKIEIAERVNDYSTIAFDLFAMVCDDAVVRGAEPVLIGSILDINSLENNLEKIKQLAEGYVKAARAANVAIVNGEIAELGNRINGFGNFNSDWGATVVWFVNKNKLLTGKEISVGDSIVAFKETGFRSNGLTLVRETFQKIFGEDWHLEELDGESIAKLALTPSRIYSKIITDAYGGFFSDGKAKIHGVVHVTGGGIPEKLKRILKPSGFGAELNDLFSSPKIMEYCQDIGNIDDETAYKNWNMGNGMFVITPEPDKIIQIANKHGVEAKVAGRIIKDKIIRIKNKGARRGKPILIFDL